MPILPLLRKVIDLDLCEIEWLWGGHCCVAVMVVSVLLMDELVRFEKCREVSLNGMEAAESNGKG